MDRLGIGLDFPGLLYFADDDDSLDSTRLKLRRARRPARARSSEKRNDQAERG